MIIEEGFKLDNVFVTKIENGFLLTIEGEFELVDTDKNRWKTYKVYVPTIEELSDKLKEVLE